MEALLQKEFEAVSVQQLGRGYGGCISDGMGYDLDNGRQKIFVKRNKNEEVHCLFINNLKPHPLLYWVYHRLKLCLMVNIRA